MTGKNPVQEAKRYEEVSRMKEILKRAGGEDVSPVGEKSVSSHRGEKPVRSPDTINAYRAREPRAESGENVDTINAYRSREPRPGSPGWAPTDEVFFDDIRDNETWDDEARSTPIRRVV